jgi:hypothetical protein
MAVRFRVALAFVSALAWTIPSAAADDGPAPAPAESAPAQALPVTIKLASTPLQAEAIRAAIESELRVPVRLDDVPPDEGLSVSVKWRRATVSYRSRQGETTTRSLDLPANAEQSVEVIALLAGNLARDEASELLARLAPPPSAAAETPAATGDSAPPAPESTPPVEAKPEPEKPKEPPKPPPPPKPLDGLIRGTPASMNFTLWHPLTTLPNTERRALNAELGFAYSRVGAIEGAGFTLGYLRVEKGVRGAVGSFGWTRVDGDLIGFQWGGLVTEGHGKLRGAEIGELASLRWGHVEGAQAGGLVSYAKNVLGAQISAVVSYADDVRGGQVGPIGIARDVQGFQLNLVGFTRDIQGGQLGLVNVARDIDGGQLGLVNVARTTDFQLGLVNVAERVDGAALGLVSIAGNGSVQPTAYVIGGTRDSINAGVKSIAGLAYSLLAVGATDDGQGDARGRAEAGGGFHVEPNILRRAPVVDRVAFELGVHFSQTFPLGTNSGANEDDYLHYRAGAGFRAFKVLWLLVGYDLSHTLGPVESVGGGVWSGLAVF